MPGKDTVRLIERAIVQIARNLGRRNFGRGMEHKLERLVNFAHVSVVDVLDDSAGKHAPATVGYIAKRLGVDPSRASRMVSGAIRAGYARRVASQEDGRRSCLALTDKGEEFAAAIRDMRLRHFASHLKGWTEEECADFARLLAKFARGTDQRHGAGAQDPAADAPPPRRAKTAAIVALDSVRAEPRRAKRARNGRG